MTSPKSHGSSHGYPLSARIPHYAGHVPQHQQRKPEVKARRSSSASSSTGLLTSRSTGSSVSGMGRSGSTGRLMSKTAFKATGGYGGHVPGVGVEPVIGLSRSEARKSAVKERSGQVTGLLERRTTTQLAQSQSGAWSPTGGSPKAMSGYAGHIPHYKSGNSHGESMHRAHEAGKV